MVPLRLELRRRGGVLTDVYLDDNGGLQSLDDDEHRRGLGLFDEERRVRLDQGVDGRQLQDTGSWQGPRVCSGGRDRQCLCVRKTFIVQTVWPACVDRWTDHNMDCELEFVIKTPFEIWAFGTLPVDQQPSNESTCRRCAVSCSQSPF